jgi:hypothetical protein
MITEEEIELEKMLKEDSNSYVLSTEEKRKLEERLKQLKGTDISTIISILQEMNKRSKIDHHRLYVIFKFVGICIIYF